MRRIPRKYSLGALAVLALSLAIACNSGSKSSSLSSAPQGGGGKPGSLIALAALSFIPS